MGRIAKPWWREEAKCYYVTYKGVQHRLDPSKKRAYELFDELKQTPETGLKSDHAVVLIDQFLSWCEKNRPDSYDWYDRFLNPFCKTIADLRVNEVKPHHVTSYIDNPKWGPSARRAAVTAIKRAFNWAVKQGHISESPVKNVEKPEGRVRDRVISLAEHKELVKAAPKLFVDVLELAWETGARPFELYRLETRHLDLENSRAVYPKEESKGKRKKTVIYFSKKALAIIKRTKRKHGPVLRNEDGNAWTIYAINCAFGRLAKKLKKKRVSLYAYRHSFAHRKITEGTDSLIVATLMNHSDVKMLQRVYAHIHQNQNFLLAQLNK